MKRIFAKLLPLLLILSLLTACGEPPVSSEPYVPDDTPAQSTAVLPEDAPEVSGVLDVPDYSGAPYVAVNNNQPFFVEEEITTEPFEEFAELDELGRCGVTFANVCRELMPTEERGDISRIHPTGWVQNQYDFVESKNLYNRCHLLGFQLTGENDNDRNLITGTRYMNTEGMLPFENMVADYVKETDHHVLYRVTPIFDGENLVADGVLMEAWSVEDEGDGVCFCVFVYNVQPGVEIDYATGENWAANELPEGDSSNENDSEKIIDVEGTYVLNTNSKKFHDPDCSGVSNMNPDNRQDYTGSREDLIEQGYEPCGICDP